MEENLSTESTTILRKKLTGFITFFFSGICAISSGVIVSMLRDRYGFEYSTTGTLLALMNIGNLIAGFLAGIFPSRIGMKRTVILLTTGYFIGYILLGISGIIAVLMAGFFIIGIGKGSTINTCTILVSNNSKSRTKGMNIMHSCYALGALLCPFIITTAATNSSVIRSIFVMAVIGLLLWIFFFSTPMNDIDTSGEIDISNTDKKKTHWSFLKSGKFWLITAFLFCQNGVEISVNGWMVTYFKGCGIISPDFSPYTVTVMWGATLIARLLIAFVVPIKNTYKALLTMGIGCIIFYGCLIFSSSQIAVVLLLAAFSFSMAGMNPTAVASAGKLTNVTSIGIMLPLAGGGAIIMPWIIGLVAEHTNLQFGMFTNIIPCIGMVVISIIMLKNNMVDE